MTATIMTAAILGLTRLQQRFGARALIVAGMTLGALGTLYLTRIRVDSCLRRRHPPRADRDRRRARTRVLDLDRQRHARRRAERRRGWRRPPSTHPSRSAARSALPSFRRSRRARAPTTWPAHTRAPDPVAHAAVHGYAVGFAWATGIFAVSALVCAALFPRRTAPRRVACGERGGPPPSGRRRRRLRRPASGAEARPAARRRHAHRPAELPPLPAAGLPGRRRRALARGDLLSATPHLSPSTTTSASSSPRSPTSTSTLGRSRSVRAPGRASAARWRSTR